MRYTEARLTAVAEALLDGLDEDAVDFRATYDGEDEEPVVLPAAFPNLLANGAQGIAVGMATSIPPHNVAGDLRRRLPSDRASGGDDRGPGGAAAGTGLSHRRRARRGPGGARRGLSHRPRLAAAARPLADGEGRGRRAARRRHRDPLPGAEGEADRAAGRAVRPNASCRSSPTSATNRPTPCGSC